MAILLGLTTYAAAAGGETFAALRAAAPVAGAWPGWCSCWRWPGSGRRPGLVPLHVWLPRAHPEAPSHVSAMLSAAMVNLGVYGVLRVGFDLLGGGTRWWWLLVLAVGALSALYGILQAAVATDLKRLLAYSTVENMGLVFVGVGAAGIFARIARCRAWPALALAAALLHVVNHAAFKTLLFLARPGRCCAPPAPATWTSWAGCARGCRPRRSCSRSGRWAPSALPPGNGFVSEWLLLQALIHGAAGRRGR